MSYIYKVFDHVNQLFMGIWQHTVTITTTDIPSDLREFADILDDVSVEMIPMGLTICHTDEFVQSHF